jgi:hypothetical protein
MLGVVVGVAVGCELDAATGSRPPLDRSDEHASDAATTKIRLDINPLDVTDSQ